MEALHARRSVGRVRVHTSTDGERASRAIEWDATTRPHQTIGPTVRAADHVFRGAGIVMRCPRCDNALVTIVKDDTRVWIGFAGVRTVQVTV